MVKHASNKYNLIDENWIPVCEKGFVSLQRIFTDTSLKALGGNPVEKAALIKLLLAIAQAAYTPDDDQQWKLTGALGLAEKVERYLHEKKDLFWLYGDKPFLQMPAISESKIQNISAVLPNIATGNTTVLFQSQIESSLSDAEKAITLVYLSGFALGGKKTDNSVVLSPGYSGKSNAKGNPSTAKPGPSLGFLGYLHSFLCGKSIIETIWLNLITNRQLQSMAHFSNGVGKAPWESIPKGEDCRVAKALKNSLMGRLVPMCRFALLSDRGLHYSEGIAHPTYKEGGFDLSTAVSFSKNAKALWVDPEKRPWRQLTALLSFMSSESPSQFDCPQLRLGLVRARNAVPEIRIWSGGLRVSNNAGEQYVSGNDDYVESEIQLSSAWIGEVWFSLLSAEMDRLENMSSIVYGTTYGYFAHFNKAPAERTKHAAMATRLFWQLCERKFQDLVNACGDDSGNQLAAMRGLFASYVNKAYNSVCPRQTARQMEAWAANRPVLSRL